MYASNFELENFSYVREWLCLMACGKLIEVDESGKKFWISEDRIEDLCGDKPNPLLVFQQFILMCAKAYPSVIGLFKKDGPLGALNNLFYFLFFIGSCKNRS